MHSAAWERLPIDVLSKMPLGLPRSMKVIASKLNNSIAAGVPVGFNPSTLLRSSVLKLIFLLEALSVGSFV